MHSPPSSPNQPVTGYEFVWMCVCDVSVCVWCECVYVCDLVPLIREELRRSFNHQVPFPADTLARWWLGGTWNRHGIDNIWHGISMSDAEAILSWWAAVKKRRRGKGTKRGEKRTQTTYLHTFFVNLIALTDALESERSNDEKNKNLNPDGQESMNQKRGIGWNDASGKHRQQLSQTRLIFCWSVCVCVVDAALRILSHLYGN